MADPTPDPWAAAVEAMWLATTGAPYGELECPAWPKCDEPCRVCFDLNMAAAIRAAMDHMLEAVIAEAFPEDHFAHSRDWLRDQLQRAAARLTNG